MIFTILSVGMLTAYAADDLTVTIDTGASVTLKDTDSDGYYDIGTADELYAFAAMVNGGNNAINGELTANITVNENVLTEDGELNGDGSNFRVWTPIGKNTNIRYNGIFDGGEHTVSGLYYNDDSADYVGLFGSVNESGKIQNVGVEDCYLNGGDYVGGVVGYNFGTITDCYNSGTVMGNDRVGGIVGYSSSETITGCYNTGDIKGNMYVGGIAGYSRGETIIDCYNTGSVSGNVHVGGVFGYTDYMSNNSTITNCYNTGSISALNYFGGLSGTVSHTVNNSYFLDTCGGEGRGIKKSAEQFASGEVAYLLGEAFGQDLSDENSLPELGGKKVYYGYEVCNSTQMTYSNTEIDEILPEHKDENDDHICDVCKTSECIYDNGFCKFCDGYEPAVPDGDAYEISNAGQLYWFAQQVNGGNNAINGELTKDIVVNENVLTENGELTGDVSNLRVWIPIGISGPTDGSTWFHGTFDGGNHTVSGLYFNDSTAKSIGLFGVTGGATIKNVGVVDSWIFARLRVGGIVGAGYDGTTILNCYNTGTLTSENYSTVESDVGGIIGDTWDSVVINCYNAGSIKGNRKEVGGVVGSAYNYSAVCIIDNCYNVGTVNGTDCVGGIVGNNGGGIVTNSYNIGTVTGDTNVGAITGKNDLEGKVTSCYYLEGSSNGGSGLSVTEAQVKAASGEEGALVDMLNEWVAEQNDAKYKGWHLCSNGYPSLNIKNSYSNNGDNHIAKCSFCGFETTEAHTYLYTANEGVINESCKLCAHSASVNLVIPENPVYNGTAYEASYTGSFTNPDTTVLIQYLSYNEDSETGYEILESAPVDAGTYVVRLSVGEVYVEQSMTIVPKEITLVGVEVEYKDYDGTPYVEIDPYYGYGGFKADGVSDYDSIEILCTSAELESANAGTYTTVIVKGLTITGEDAHNYTVVSEATIPVYNIWGNSESSVTVYEKNLSIKLFDQEAGSLDAIDQSKWKIDEYYGLLEGHRIDSLKLIAEMNEGSTKYGTISVEEGSVKIVDANGNDVTANYGVSTNSATLTLTCPDHDEFDHGFCTNCGGYEKAVYNENEGYYEIANAGQLFWFAEYVANVSNEANAKLTDNITVPEGKEWTPIYNLYGTFDGNYKAISGLNVSESDSDYVGFIGYVGYYANVCNLHIANSNFVDADATYVGAIVGYHGGGEITNCYTDETVNVESDGVCGELVGYTAYTTMQNCYAHGVLAGNGHYGTFENCYYIGEDDEIDGTTAVTTGQLASGEVAYLLQSGILGEPIYDDEWNEIGTTEPELVWGQHIGVEAYPVFGGEKVYYADTYFNIKAFEIISATNGRVIVTLPEAGSYTVILIDYEGGRMNSVDFVEVNNESDEPVWKAATSEKGINLGIGDKIMLLQNMTNLVPLCDKYIVK